MDNPIDFGDYVRIEMKRYGIPNEMFLHKVIGRFKSSHAVAVPIDCAGHSYKPQPLDGMQDVLNVVQCGVDETQVFKVAVKDVSLSNCNRQFV